MRREEAERHSHYLHSPHTCSDEHDNQDTVPIVSLAYQVMEKLDASGCFCCLVIFLLPESSGQANNYVRAGDLMGPLDVSTIVE